MLQRGNMVGHYQIAGCLGKGGEGSVYLAVHIQTGQLWALKEIPLASPAGGRRQEGERDESGPEETPFGKSEGIPERSGQKAGNGKPGDPRLPAEERSPENQGCAPDPTAHEFEMYKALRHPSLPVIVEAVRTDSCLYLVMEYIHGRSLQQIMAAEHRLDVPRVIDAGLKICEALTYLHTRPVPVFHLDLKPANIIVKNDGRFVLVDLGAARRKYEPGSGDQAAGMRTSEAAVPGRNTREPVKGMRRFIEPERIAQEVRKGTPGFAAPEQYSLERPLNAQTDIYSLGAILYYLISGVKFSDPCIKSKIPGCPDLLGKVILRALAAEPSERYGSAAEFGLALRRAEKEIRRQRFRIQFEAAALMGILAGSFAFQSVTAELYRGQSEYWNYDHLLEEASTSAGERSAEYYRQAVFLDPGNVRAAASLLEESVRDGVLSSEDEKNLRDLLVTVPAGREKTYEDSMSENRDDYGSFCTSLGLAYWFQYSGGNAQSAAASWFDKAVSAGESAKENTEEDSGNRPEEAAENSAGENAGGSEAEDTEKNTEKLPAAGMEADGGETGSSRYPWLRTARMYAHFAHYRSAVVQSPDQSEEETNGKILRCWDELKGICREEFGEEGRRDGAEAYYRFAKEALSEMIVLADSVVKCGIRSSEIRELADQIKRRAEEYRAEEEAARTENGDGAEALTDSSPEAAGATDDVWKQWTDQYETLLVLIGNLDGKAGTEEG